MGILHPLFFTYIYIYTFIHILIHSLIHSLIYSFIHYNTRHPCLLNYLFVKLFVICDVILTYCNLHRVPDGSDLERCRVGHISRGRRTVILERYLTLHVCLHLLQKLQIKQ